MRAYFGPAISRQSTQPLLRNRPGLDGQRFVINRGRPVQASGMRRTAYLPLETHWKPAPCSEVGCRFYVNGWVTTIDLTPHQDPQQLEERQYASRILHQSGWDYYVEWDGSCEIFRFAAGQDHYMKIDRGHKHWIPVERDPIFVRNGRQLDYDQFFDEFNENSYQLNRRAQEG